MEKQARSKAVTEDQPTHKEIEVPSGIGGKQPPGVVGAAAAREVPTGIGVVLYDPSTKKVTQSEIVEITEEIEEKCIDCVYADTPKEKQPCIECNQHFSNYIKVAEDFREKTMTKITGPKCFHCSTIKKLQLCKHCETTVCDACAKDGYCPVCHLTRFAMQTQAKLMIDRDESQDFERRVEERAKQAMHAGYASCYLDMQRYFKDEADNEERTESVRLQFARISDYLRTWYKKQYDSSYYVAIQKKQYLEGLSKSADLLQKRIISMKKGAVKLLACEALNDISMEIQETESRPWQNQ